MTDPYPWKKYSTTEDVAGEDDARYETPGGAQQKADTALQDAKEYTDAHVGGTTNLADDSVTRAKIAPGAVGATELDQSLLNYTTDIAVANKFNLIDEQLAETAEQVTVLGETKAAQTELITTNNNLAVLTSRVDGVDRAYGETYANLSAIQAAFPAGNNMRYIAADNGIWYYWSGSAWTSGGVFQGVGIASNAVDNYQLTELSKDILSTTFLNRTGNLLTGTSITGGYINASFATVTEAGYNQSNWFGVTPGDTLYVYRPYQINTILVYKNAAGDFIKSTVVSNSLGWVKDIVPANAATCSFDLYADSTPRPANLNKNVAYTMNGLNSAVVPFIEKLIEGKKATGKKAVFLGDSITFGSGTDGTNIYPNLLKTILGLTTITNYGIGGSTISNVSGVAVDVDPYPMVDRYTSMDSDASIVVLFGGTNDYGRGINPDSNVPGSSAMHPLLGTISSTDKTTFYGALNVLLEGLIAKYPSALIVGVLPLHRYRDDFLNTRSLKLVDYVNAERAAYEKYGIPVLDLYAGGSFYPTNAAHKTAWAPDGLHPNSTFHQKVLAPRLANFIESLL